MATTYKIEPLEGLFIVEEWEGAEFVRNLGGFNTREKAAIKCQEKAASKRAANLIEKQMKKESE